MRVTQGVIRNWGEDRTKAGSMTKAVKYTVEECEVKFKASEP